MRPMIALVPMVALLIARDSASGEPMEPAARKGEIEVVVTPAEHVRQVLLIERLPNDIMRINQRLIPAVPAAEKGHFIVADLPQGVYDICIEIDPGREAPTRRIEGVNLDVGAAEGQPAFDWWPAGERMGARNFDPAATFEEGVAVSEDDKAQAIRKKFRLSELQERFDTLARISKFENSFRVIYAAGTPEKAKALVELRRDGGHYAEKGSEVIWRVEVWSFAWANGAWETLNRAAKVLERLRIQRAEFDKLDRFFDPKLGGISVKDGERKKVEYTVPPSLDGKMGKPAAD